MLNFGINDIGVSVLAYSLIFGKDKTSNYPAALGVGDNVTRNDMILDDKIRMRSTLFESDTVRKRYGDPA